MIFYAVLIWWMFLILDVGQYSETFDSMLIQHTYTVAKTYKFFKSRQTNRRL